MRQHKQLISEDIRQAVFERDHHSCRYCGNTECPFSPDHVYPESRGGETSIDNLVTACRRCNGKKVGMWPKPIGYWNEREKISKKSTHQIKQDGALILIGLLASGILFAMMWLFPNSIEWLVMKLLITIWFGVCVYYAAYWIWDFLRS